MKNTAFIIIVLFLSLNLAACGAGSSAGDLSISDLNVNNLNLDNSSIGGTGVVTLSWTPPTQYTDNTVMNDLAGYKIYYGTESNQLVFLIDIGSNLSSYMIENDQRLQAGTSYYFAITAYNNAQVEGAMSNIVRRDL